MKFEQAAMQLLRIVPSGTAAAVAASLLLNVLATAVEANSDDALWHFAVAGDSRICGDVVMPSIASGADVNHALFYWYLGHLCAIHNINEDFKQLHPKASMADYLSTAWVDFKRNQIEPFGRHPSLRDCL